MKVRNFGSCAYIALGCCTYKDALTHPQKYLHIPIHAHSCSIKEDIYALHIKRLTRRKVTASRNRTGEESGATHFNCRDTAAAFVPPHLVKQQFVELISYPRIHTHTRTARGAWIVLQNPRLCVFCSLWRQVKYMCIHIHMYVWGLVASSHTRMYMCKCIYI